MAIRRKPFIPWLLALVLLGTAACSGDSPAGPDMTPASITLEGLPATMDALGATLQVSAVVSNAAGERLSASGLQWSSSDPSVATVSSSGLLTSVADGSATITAALPEGLRAAATVNVSQAIAAIQKLQGDAQQGTIGTTLEEPLWVRAVDAAGTPVVGAYFTARLEAGRGTLSEARDVAVGPGEMAIDYLPTHNVGQHRIVIESEGATTIFRADITLPPVRIVNEALDDLVQGDFVRLDLYATGGDNTIYFWSLLSGSLPPGLSLSSSGSIYGTPTLDGSYSFELGVESGGAQAAKTFTIDVYPPLSIVEFSWVDFMTDTSYEGYLEATGGLPQKRWSASGLPAGFALAEDGYFTASPSQVGEYSVTISVESGPVSDSWRSTISVYDPLEFVTPPALPNATIDDFYSYEITVRGGNGRTYDNDIELVAGSLPLGLSLSYGRITGIPSLTGTSRFTLRFTDNEGPWVERQFTLIVNR